MSEANDRKIVAHNLNRSFNLLDYFKSHNFRRIIIISNRSTVIINF